MHERDWIDYLQAALTPSVALIAVYIGWQQWRTARDKLNLDLFAKRLAIYEALQELLESYGTGGWQSRWGHKDLTEMLRDGTFFSGKEKTPEKYRRGLHDQQMRCRLAIREAKWLLGAEMEQYLQNILDRTEQFAARLHWLDTAEKGGQVQRDWLEAREGFLAERDVADKMFAPFLTIQR